MTAPQNKPLTDLPVTREFHPHSVTPVPGLNGTFGTYEERAHTRLTPRPVVAQPCPEVTA